MTARTLTVKLAIGVLAFAVPAAFGQATPGAARTGPGQGGMSQNMPNQMRPGDMRGMGDRHDHGGGGNNFAYLPWVSGGFGPYYPADSGSQQAQSPQPPPVYDIAPAVGMAAYTETEYDNRWAGLQVLLDRARKEFQISDDYLSAKKDFDNAQRVYDDSVASVIEKLMDDPNYKQLVERRTQEQVALKTTGLDTPQRNEVATDKMHYGSQVSQMEAVALANDSSVQDAKTKLVSADENLRLKEKRFEADLYKRPDVAAARQQVEVARANKAGAEGYLYGAYITRADQLDANSQTYTGNTVYYTAPYYRGYYGLGVGDF
jgi:hypothetical protein